MILPKPRASRHIIEAIHFPPRSNSGWLACTCGAEMSTDDFPIHRRAAGLSNELSQLTIPDELSWWKATKAKQQARRR